MSKDDQEAYYRAQAKHFREIAKIAREDSRNCKERRDWVGKLKADCRVREYVATAQHFDGKARNRRAERGPL